MDLAVCHHCGANNFYVAPRFLVNFFTPELMYRLIIQIIVLE